MHSNFLKDLRLLYHICLVKNAGQTHAERMENYFGPQAADYDSFRDRLLYGRSEMYKSLPCPPSGVWLEIGGGAGRSLEFLGDRIFALEKVYLVDISPSLLQVAHSRAKRLGWRNVELIEGDASTFQDLPLSPDVVTFSYSLTMIPNWFESLHGALSLMKPTSRIGVVDFYQPEKRPHPSIPIRQGLLWRMFWQIFFQGDDVMLDRNHLPYLEFMFEKEDLFFGHGKIPYLPLKAPYYAFTGRPRQARI
jgi:S-adenosylmethionine-diacylgycerolhomoserine-N-methlytransferase